jgi:hypothetical protein
LPSQVDERKQLAVGLRAVFKIDGVLGFMGQAALENSRMPARPPGQA